MWTVPIVKQRLREALSARRDQPGSPASLRAQEAVAWLGLLDQRDARALVLWAFAAAEGVPLRQILKARGISATNFYRQVSAALGRIVLELEVRQSVDVQPWAGTRTANPDPGVPVQRPALRSACHRQARGPAAR
jgi:hypothetical protein